MAAYASMPDYADRKLHPRLLLVIAAGHAAVIAALMMAKMDLPTPFVPTITRVTLIDAPKPPPPRPAQHPQNTQTQARPTFDHPQQLVETPQQKQPDVGPTQTIPNLAPFDPTPISPLVPAQPVRTGPRFATPESELKPPYPQQKELAGEEATLRLRLSIDAQGRVIAVDPVGSADPAFLAAARRHILAHWRYQPATEDGHPVPSSTVITLQFRLDG